MDHLVVNDYLSKQDQLVLSSLSYDIATAQTQKNNFSAEDSGYTSRSSEEGTENETENSQRSSMLSFPTSYGISRSSNCS